MSYGPGIRPTNWWRVVAIVLLCIVAVAGVVLYGERSTSRDLTAAIDRLEDEVSGAHAENRALGESLAEVQDRLGDSQRISGELADIIGTIATGSDEIDGILAEIADQVRRDLGTDPGSGTGSAGGDS